MNNKAIVQKRLSQFVQQKRRELNLTQIQFAEHLGELIGDELSYGAIQGWESPRKNTGLPSIESFRALATLAGMTMDEFYLFLTDKSPVDLNNGDANRLKAQVIQSSDKVKLDLLRMLQDELFNKCQEVAS